MFRTLAVSFFALLSISGLCSCGKATPGAAEEVCCLNAGATLGTNLEQIGPVTRSWVFVDVFKHSSPFRSVPSGQTLQVDAEGWVTSLNTGQSAVTEILDPGGATPHFDLGPYTLLYDGSGTLSVSGPVSISSQAAGKIVFTLNSGATSKVLITLSQTNPANPVRNIRVLMAGYESNHLEQVFHPDFLDSLRSFKVIRYLNWTSSNNSPFVEWSQRTRTTSQTQNSSYGVAPEYVVDLSNRLLADAWINVPHLASDDAIVQLATFLRDNLDPRLRVFVEHSNEIWGEFQQSTWAEQKGTELNLSGDVFEARIRFHSERSVAIFKLFESVFGAGSPRVVRVLGAGHMNSGSVSEVMDWKEAYKQADLVSTAPYFGGRLGTDAYMDGTAPGYPYAKPVKNMSVSEFLSALDNESQLSNSASGSNSALAQARGLGYVAYEGGPAAYFEAGSSWASQPVATNLFQASCRDSGMRAVYLENMKRWRASSAGGLYMAFNHLSSADSVASGWYSCWGALEYQQQDESSVAKWLALTDFLSLYPNP